WLPVASSIMGSLLNDMLSRETFDYRRALKEADVKANTRVMVDRPKEEMARYQHVAMTVVVTLLVLLAIGGVLLVRNLRAQAALAADRDPNALGPTSAIPGTIHQKSLP